MTDNVYNCITIAPGDFWEGGTWSDHGATVSGRRFILQTHTYTNEGAFHVELQAAIDALPSSGGTIQIWPGQATADSTGHANLPDPAWSFSNGEPIPYPVNGPTTIDKPVRIQFMKGAQIYPTTVPTYLFNITSSDVEFIDLDVIWDAKKLSPENCIIYCSSGANDRFDNLKIRGKASVAAAANLLTSYVIRYKGYSGAPAYFPYGLNIDGFQFVIRDKLISGSTSATQQTASWSGTEYSSSSYGVGLLRAYYARGVSANNLLVTGAVETEATQSYANCIITAQDLYYATFNDCIYQHFSTQSYNAGSNTKNALPILHILNVDAEGGHCTVADNFVEAIKAKHFVAATNNAAKWISCTDNFIGRMSQVASLFYGQGGHHFRVTNNSTHNITGMVNKHPGGGTVWTANGASLSGPGIDDNLAIGDYIYFYNSTYPTLAYLVCKIINKAADSLTLDLHTGLTGQSLGTATELTVSPLLAHFDGVLLAEYGGNCANFRKGANGPVYVFDDCVGVYRTSSDIVEMGANV